MKKEMTFTEKLAFTLIEIIVVVAVIAVISATVIISFPSLVPRRLEADARKIVADIRWARQMAITRHMNYAVSFDPNRKEYSIYMTPSGALGELTAANLVKKGVLQVSLNLLSTNLWIYSPQGSFYFYGRDNIPLSSQGKSKQIKVFPTTGYVRIE